MKYRTLLVVLALLINFLLITIPGNADEIKPCEDNNLSLSEIVAIALENNRSILSEQENNNIFKLSATMEGRDMLPNAGVSSTYTFNTYVRKLGGFTLNNRNQLTTAIEVTQPLTTLYERGLEYKAAKERFDISFLNTEIRKEIVITEVSNLYFDIILQKRIICLHEKNIQRLQEVFDVAQNRYEEGTALSRDAFKVKIEIERAKHQLLVEQNELEVLYSQLKDAMGIDLCRDIDILTDFIPSDILQKEPCELYNIALCNRRELKQARKDINIAKINKKIELADYIPDVELYARYVNLQGASNFAIDNNLLLGFNASYTFLDWNKRHLKAKQAESEIKKEVLDLESLENSIVIDVKERVNALDEAKDLIDVSQKNVKLAEENLRIIRNRYDVGLALIIDLLADQTTLLEAEVNLASAELELQKNIIELKKSLGILIQ